MISIVEHFLTSGLTEIDTAVGILWLRQNAGQQASSTKDIAQLIQEAGGPSVNVSRLRGRLKAEPRVRSSGTDQFSINVRHMAALDKQFGPYAGPRRPPNSGSILDVGQFSSARKYIQNIAWQINVSYDLALFDCCGVMCRRLFETLAIDAFEHQGFLSLITDGNGDIMRLSGIIGVLKNQTSFRISRQVKEAADKFKNVGDWSAHSRAFIARQGTIDSVSAHLSAASMELLHLAGQD